MKLDSFLLDVVGLQPLAGGGATDATRRIMPGAQIPYIDNYWGGGEMIYARASAAIEAQAPVQFASALNTLTNPDGSGSFTAWELSAAPLATAVTPGIPLGVAFQAMASGDYGWFIRSGRTPIRSLVVGAAGPIWGSGTVARIFTTDTAQKLWSGSRQLFTGLGNTVIIPVLKGVSGAFTLRVANTRGLVVGMAITGTNVGASSAITAIDHTTGVLTVSVANAGAVTGNLTFTYSLTAAGSNPWLPVCDIDRPWQEHTV